MSFKNNIIKILRYSEKWTKTDMVYLTHGGFWLFVSQAISSLAGFFLAITFANLLPKDIYGEYRFVLSLASVLSIFSLSGMTAALTQAVARGFEGSIIKAVKTKLRWGLLGGALGLIMSIYYYFNGNISLSVALFITGLFLPFFEAVNTLGGIFSGRMLFKDMTRYSATRKIIPVIVMIATVFLTRNLFFILLAYFITHTLVRYITLRLIIRKYKPNDKEDPETITYGKHLSLMVVLDRIAGALDKILIFHFLSATQLAFYSFALLPVDQIRVLLQNVGVLAFPKFSRRSSEEIKAAILKKILLFMALATGLILIYFILAPIFYKLVFPEYLNSILYSRIYALSLLAIPAALVSTALRSKMKKKELYILVNSTAVLKIIGLLIAAPFFGLIGVLAVIIATQFYNLIFGLILLSRIKN